MKKMIALLLAAMLMMMTCGALADPVTVNDLLGDWTVTDMADLNAIFGSDLLGADLIISDKAGFRFSANGTGQLLMDRYAEKTAWKLSGDTLTIGMESIVNITGKVAVYRNTMIISEIAVTIHLYDETIPYSEGNVLTLLRGWESGVAATPVKSGSEAERLLGDWVLVRLHATSPFFGDGDYEALQEAISGTMVMYSFRADGTMTITSQYVVYGQVLETEITTFWTYDSSEGISLSYYENFGVFDPGQTGEQTRLMPYLDGQALVLIPEVTEDYKQVFGISSLGIIMARPGVTLTQDEIDALISVYFAPAAP